ncbi:Hypothetical protein, putative [Bodo saltans]|uniref:Uncharacterized protein n=1 Tax=Bodo saltans TaxID=75058 RepID=A0A0S4IWM3_BODSA|nr:Hypothetical protein, putative [Bodo saltans]|eukprot:CUG06324.1 Hypothetical protein, putative [Bodo saltans]
MASVVRAPASAINCLVYEYLDEAHPDVANILMANAKRSSERAREVFGNKSLNDVLASVVKAPAAKDAPPTKQHFLQKVSAAAKKHVVADFDSNNATKHPVAVAKKASLALETCVERDNKEPLKRPTPQPTKRAAGSSDAAPVKKASRSEPNIIFLLAPNAHAPGPPSKATKKPIVKQIVVFSSDDDEPLKVPTSQRTRRAPKPAANNVVFSSDDDEPLRLPPLQHSTLTESENEPVPTAVANRTHCKPLKCMPRGQPPTRQMKLQTQPNDIKKTYVDDSGIFIITNHRPCKKNVRQCQPHPVYSYLNARTPCHRAPPGDLSCRVPPRRCPDRQNYLSLSYG